MNYSLAFSLAPTQKVEVTEARIFECELQTTLFLNLVVYALLAGSAIVCAQACTLTYFVDISDSLRSLVQIYSSLSKIEQYLCITDVEVA